ncbi:ribonuclease P protein component [Roseomonas frigidaquae]|uniref:Ribonuclease P protein component n=1 Tax=Falsiroseomonas frigidaquae TaxID=487318 RepID=A0ABX1F756_9PROT|nr:ribonuclease P protein component [Falsiroseomonas frigidaquae]NKE48231.1 ribonuclease P protein component [Falsiroseomonas frigidaquae]
MPARPPRLKLRREFKLVASRGLRAARPGVVVQVLKGTDGPLRVGFTVTKKVGNAVIRNRAKRRLREAARLLLGQDAPAGFDLVMIGRDATARRDFATLLGDLRGALRQGGVLPPKEQHAVLAPKEQPAGDLPPTEPS